ncbi:uncharacterized protein FA14DRAFT_159382 [Meira miltonrushii]|uniref:CUE domain-containing protein n=1 Tax=Meira miltonrushii TaxID=1280837 RepID=A0A316VHX7_9BASI|nr:uncharacterized protein FA14DRAFT_159382 [Meira miltonrushii]PWN37239.1 hypothetical protein FA14DRAFT_159382 [Meira miltonrushii]
MAVTRYDLGQNSASVIEALSQVPSKELVILLTQHATLPRLITNSLHILAINTVQNGLKGLRNEQQKYADQIANILRRLISRGDPSQARRLVPTHASLIDLAVCMNSKDILARLVDEKGAEDILKAVVTAYSSASSSKDTGSIAPAAKVLARLLYALPRWKHASNAAARKGQTSKAPFPSSKDVEKLFDSFQKHYLSIKLSTTVTAADESKLYSKISILEATWALLERQVSIDALHAADLDRLLANSTNNSGVAPLVDLPLFVDLALVKPLVPLLRKIGARSQSLDLLAQKIETLSSKEGSSISSLSSAWKQVVDLSQRDTVIQGRSHSSINPELLSTITAIMPQWEQHLDKLKDKLSNSPYLDQSNDLIIQMLLDEGEPQIGDIGAPSTSTVSAQSMDPMELLRQRANVFDDEPLESSKLIYGGGKGKGRNTKIALGSGLSDEMKAAIIARAEAPDSDEEDREEWDPFAESSGMNRLEVGFEEELDEEGDQYTGNVSIRKPAADEEGSEEEQDHIEEAEADGRHGGAGHGAIHSNTAKANVESERAAERIMITAWKESGPGLFEKQHRGSSGRKQLVARLNDIPTSNKRWDDQLIESWATMFNRNPRKDKLLANVDDLMRIGNTNRAPIPSTQDSEDGISENRSKFGPDRGRGGRILGGGGQHSRGGGRGGNRGGRGRGGGGGNNRGNRGKPGRGGH